MAAFHTNEAVFNNVHGDVNFCVEAAKLDFALELKRLMDQSEMKNFELAERLGVSNPMVSKLLRGDTNVTIETMVKASRAVGGEIFVRIIRNNCTPKFLEVVKMEHHRVSDSNKIKKSISAAGRVWGENYLMRANGNEKKSIAA